MTTITVIYVSAEVCVWMNAETKIGGMSSKHKQIWRGYWGKTLEFWSDFCNGWHFPNNLVNDQMPRNPKRAWLRAYECRTWPSEQMMIFLFSLCILTLPAKRCKTRELDGFADAAMKDEYVMKYNGLRQNEFTIWLEVHVWHNHQIKGWNFLCS